MSLPEYELGARCNSQMVNRCTGSCYARHHKPTYTNCDSTSTAAIGLLRYGDFNALEIDA